MRDRVGRFFGLRPAAEARQSPSRMRVTREIDGAAAGDGTARDRDLRSWLAVLVLKGGLALSAAWILAVLMLLMRAAYRLA
jgi:hypothetical protein